MADPILSLSLYMPLHGAWSADIQVATSDVPASERYVIGLEGQPLTGRIARAGAYADRVLLRVIGGVVDWQEDFEVQHYTSATAARVLSDLGVSTDTPVTDALPHWTRPAGTRGQAMQVLSRTLGLNWRCNPDGSVRLRAESPVPVTLSDSTELRRDPGRGVVDIAVEQALIIPGVQVGQDVVSDVLYEIEPGGRLRCRYWIAQRGSPLERIAQWATRQSLYLGQYACKVTRQAPDGTLDLEPDDARVAGAGLQGIPIRHGLPGCTVKVAAGTRVRLAWDDGDPRVPYAALWDSGDVTEVQIGGAVAVALSTLVKAELEKIQQAHDTHTHTVVTTGSATTQSGTTAPPAAPIGSIGDVAAGKLKTA